MGRWVAAVLAAMCVLGGAACHKDASSGARDDVAHGARVVFPVLPAIDPGVMEEVGIGVLDGETAKLPHAVPPGFKLALDRCELRAPGEWVVGGTVVTPNDSTAHVTLRLGLSRHDALLRPWVHRVTFSRSGHFAVAVQSTVVASSGPLQAFDDDRVTGCFASLVTRARRLALRVSAPPTAIDAPFEYSAPADSIQAFGIGAPLDRPNDPRTISLYTVRAGVKSAITKAWVPVVEGQRPALRAVTSYRSWCTTISVGIGPENGKDSDQTTVTTRLGCSAPADDPQNVADTGEAVNGAPGFRWAQPLDVEQPPVARRSIGGYDVWVQGGTDVSRATVARIAATLTTRRNIAVIPPREMPATIDAAVAEYIGGRGGLSGNERARFKYRAGWLVVVESQDDEGLQAIYNLLRFEHLATGWSVTAVGDPNRGNGCLYGPYVVRDSRRGDRVAISITNDPQWKIQGFVDGHWQTVPTEGGVLFTDLTVAHPARVPDRQRPIDGTGHVAACFLADNPDAAD